MEDAPKTADEFYGKLHERLEELKLVSFLETAIGDIEQDEQLKQEVYKLTMWMPKSAVKIWKMHPKPLMSFMASYMKDLKNSKKKRRNGRQIEHISHQRTGSPD